MSATCELTDLPAQMCSHCRGLDTPRHPDLVVLRTTIARRDGFCDVCGEWTVREGDTIYLVDEDTGGYREELWAGKCCVKDW